MRRGLPDFAPKSNVTKRVPSGELDSVPRTGGTDQLTRNAERFASRRFRFSAIPAWCYAVLPAARTLSVSRESDRGAEGTRMVPLGPRNLGPKLSDSRVNNALGVNRLVPFEYFSRSPCFGRPSEHDHAGVGARGRSVCAADRVRVQHSRQCHTCRRYGTRLWCALLGSRAVV